MKSFLFILLLLSICYTTQGQEATPPRNTYFFVGMGFPIVNVRDQAHSPLLYRGMALSVRMGLERLSNNSVSRFSASLNFGYAAPKMASKKEKHLSRLNLMTTDIGYAYYRLIDKYNTEGWNHYAGGAITFTFDNRSYNLPSNNLFGYQMNTSINVGGFIHKKMNDKWAFNYEAYTPLLSYALRPSYLGMLPMKGANISPQNMLANGKIVTVNKLFRFYNRFALDNQFKDYRARRLSYTWDFHANYVAPKPLHSILSGVGYESLYKQ